MMEAANTFAGNRNMIIVSANMFTCIRSRTANTWTSRSG